MLHLNHLTQETWDRTTAMKLLIDVFVLFVANNGKLLSDFGIRNGSRLQADDFLQDYTLLVNVVHW